MLQVLQVDWDPTFSEHSFGFRPNRSAHQAVSRAQGHIAAGHRWVVDIDLEKFLLHPLPCHRFLRMSRTQIRNWHVTAAAHPRIGDVWAAQAPKADQRHGRFATFRLAEVAIPRRLFAEILRLIDGLRPKPAPT